MESMEQLCQDFLNVVNASKNTLSAIKTNFKIAYTEIMYQNYDQLSAIEQTQQNRTKQLTQSRTQKFWSYWKSTDSLMQTNSTSSEETEEDQILKNISELPSFIKQLKNPWSYITLKNDDQLLQKVTDALDAIDLYESNKDQKEIQINPSPISNILELLGTIQKYRKELTKFVNLKDEFDQLEEIYIQYLQNFKNLSKKFLKDNDSETFFSQLLLDQQYYEIAIPSFGEWLTSEMEMKGLVEQDNNIDENIINQLSAKNIKIKRIGTKEVFMYQRYLVSFFVKTMVFNINQRPGVVFRVKRTVNGKKRYNYFFISEIPRDGIPLSQLLAQGSRENVLLYYTDDNKEVKIPPEKFALHYLASILTSQFEFLSQSYYFTNNDIVCYPDEEIPKQITQFSNPLYAFKEIIYNYPFEITFWHNFFVKQDIFVQWFKCFDLIRSMNDFQYPIRNKTRKEDFERKRSMQFSFQGLEKFIFKLLEFEQAIQKLKEISMPFKKWIVLSQVTEKYSRQLSEFLKVEIKHKTMNEYIQFIKKENIKQIAERVVSQYTEDIYMESQIEKMAEENLNSFKSKNYKELDYHMWKYYIQSSNHLILQVFQSIHLKYDLPNPIRRQQVLEFLAYNQFFLHYFIKNFGSTLFDIFVNQFHKSWFDCDNWKIPLQSSHDIFLELLAKLFNVNIDEILKDMVFHSLKNTNEKHYSLLKVYFQNQKLKSDIGYPKKKTILELALENQQFQFILVLLQCGEGKQIHLNYFYHLLERQWETQDFMTNNLKSSIQGVQINDVEIVPNILAKLIRIHPKFLRNLLWEHIWTQIFTKVNLFISQENDMNDYINIIFKGKYEFEEDTLQPFKNIEQYLEDFEEINDWKYLVIHHGLYQQKKLIFKKNHPQIIQIAIHLDFRQYILWLMNYINCQKLKSFDLNVNWDSIRIRLISLRKSYQMQQHQIMQYNDFINIFQFLRSYYTERNLLKVVSKKVLSTKILLSILLLPSLTSPQYEVLWHDQQDAKQQILINTNHYFDLEQDIPICSTGVVQTRSKEIKFQVKNIYFCLDFMNTEILLEEQTDYLKIVTEWIRYIQYLNRTIQEVSASHQFVENIGVVMTKNQLLGVLNRAFILNNIKKGTTYIELLKQCDELTGNWYEKVLQHKDLLPLDRYELEPVIEDHIYEQIKVPYQFYLSEDNQELKGAYQLLKIAQKYISFIKDINFHRIKKKNQLLFLLKKINYAEITEEKFNDIINELENLSKNHNLPFQDIYFKDAPLLNMDHFNRFQLDRILTLTIINIPLINDFDIITLSTKCQNLYYLNISNSQSITSISQTKTMINQLMINPYQNCGLIFPKLKVLVANNMPYLKEIDLVAPELTHLSTKSCSTLQTIYFASPRLQKLNVESSLSIKFELKLLWSVLGIELSPNLNIFKCFGALYKEKIETLSPLILFLNKAGLLQQDIFQYVKLNKKIMDQGKKLISDAIILGFLRNPNYNNLNLREINQEWKNHNTIYYEFLNNLHQLLQKTIEGNNEVQKSSFEKFFEQIIKISICWSKIKHLQLLGQIIKDSTKIIKIKKKMPIELDFSELHQIPWEGFHDFIQQIKQCEMYQISHLDLSHNYLNDDYFQGLQFFFDRGLITQSNFQILHLSLKNTGINDEILDTLSSWLFKSKNLRILDLSNNQIRNFKLKCQSDLTTLYLNQNNLETCQFSQYFQIITLESSLNQCDLQGLINCLVDGSIKYLDVSNNNFSDQNHKLLVEALMNSQIETLLIKDIIFDSKMAKISQLRELHVTISSMETYELIMNLIKENRNLQTLILEFQKVRPHFHHLQMFYEAILMNPSLNEINIKNFEENQIKGIEDLNLNHLAFEQKEKARKMILRIKKELNGKLKEKRQESYIKVLKPQPKFVYKLDGFKIDSSVDFWRMGLSIDGGGIRGLVPATIINILSDKLKKEPFEIFDYVGGTSIGGIIALALTGTQDYKQPIGDHNEIVKIFTEYGKNIFDRSAFVGNFYNLIDKCKYNPKGIEDVLQKYFSVTQLSDVMPNTNVLVTAVKLQDEGFQEKKKIAKIFSSRLAKKDQRKNFLMRDVGRSTSAAPTYFPAAQIQSLKGKKYCFIDGGVGKNDPSKLVLDEIAQEARNDGNSDKYFLLSLATGTPIQTTKMKQDGGFAQVGHIMNAVWDSNQGYQDLDIEQNFPGKFKRIETQIKIEGIKNYKALLDNTDPSVLDVYKQSAEEYAHTALLQEFNYGNFKDRCLVDWIAENTARRKEYYQ